MEGLYEKACLITIQVFFKNSIRGINIGGSKGAPPARGPSKGPNSLIFQNIAASGVNTPLMRLAPLVR